MKIDSDSNKRRIYQVKKSHDFKPDYYTVAASRGAWGHLPTPSRRICPLPLAPSQKEQNSQNQQYVAKFWSFVPSETHFAPSMPPTKKILVSPLQTNKQTKNTTKNRNKQTNQKRKKGEMVPWLASQNVVDCSCSGVSTKFTMASDSVFNLFISVLASFKRLLSSSICSSKQKFHKHLIQWFFFFFLFFFWNLK